MRRVIILSLVVLTISFLSNQSIQGCTAFCINQGKEIVVGRNLDWHLGTGLIIVNKRNVVKEALVARSENPASWISKYGSITFNQYGREYPMDGMNEAGLVVTQMWLEETQYPKSDDRSALHELVWIQYQLDNHGSVQEVINSNTAIRISNQTRAPLHFLACDRRGNCATIEFLKGDMVVHTGKGLPVMVLANNPYQESIDYLKEYIRAGGPGAVSDSYRSDDRFVRAANMIREYQNGVSESIIDFGFEILSSVAQGEYTQWSIVYDLGHRGIHFKTKSHGKRKTIRLSDFNFSCQSPVRILDINTEYVGGISGYFIDYDLKYNRKLILDSFQKTFPDDMSNEWIELLSNLPELYHCNE